MPRESIYLNGYDRSPTIHPHWCHIASTVAYSGSLAYCTILSAVDDITIISQLTLLSDRGKPIPYAEGFWQSIC